MKANPKYPLQEYKNAGEDPVYCLLGGHNFVVPLSYHGDKEAFVKDLFSNNEVSETAKPSDYIDIDGYKILPPQKWQGKLTPQIKNRMIDLAVLKYNSAVRLARIHKQIDEKSQLTLNDKKVGEQFDAIMGILEEKGGNTLESFNKFIASASEHLSRNVVNVGAKIVTAPLLLTAIAVGKNSETGKALNKAAKIVVKNVWQNSFVDEEKSKKAADNLNKFLDKACSKFIKTTIPVITKMAKVTHKVYKNSTIEIKNTAIEHKKRTTLGLMLSLAGIGGGGFSLRGQSSQNNTEGNTSKTEMVVAPEHESIQTKFYTISDVNSLEKALKDTEPLIHRTLLPTEFFRSTGYTDNNTTPNTLGAGLFYYPINGDPNNSCWISTRLYLKQHPEEKITYEKAMELTLAWAQKRENGRVFKAMANQLKGCTLTQNQLAAIYSVYFNSEKSGKILCNHIRNNPDESTLKTAAFIAKLKPDDPNFRDGIKKRHCHEALVYLNYNNYCEKMFDFNIQSGLNSENKYFVSTAVTHIKNMTLFNNFIKELSNDNIGKNADILINKMLDYKPQNSENTKVTSVNDFINNNTNGDIKTAMLNSPDLPNYTTCNNCRIAKNFVNRFLLGQQQRA